jgi:hypothetical protein
MCDFSKEQCSSLKMILRSKHVGAILNFKKYDINKEQRSSLKMILGSKHVGAILNVLM